MGRMAGASPPQWKTAGTTRAAAPGLLIPGPWGCDAARRCAQPDVLG